MKYYIIMGRNPVRMIGLFSGTEEQANEHRKTLKGASMFQISKEIYDLRSRANVSD